MALCLGFFMGQAEAQDFTIRNFPIPISIDGEHVRSGAFLQFEMKNYGVPFSKFSAGKLDPRETVFAELVKGIQRNDPKAVEKVLMPPRVRKPAPDPNGGVVSAPPLPPDKNAEETGAVYRSAFGNLENIDVIAQVLVGSKSLFVWDAKLPGRPRRRAFSVEPDGTSRLVAREVTAAAPADILILSVLEDGVKDPAAYAAVSDPHLRYRQPLAVEGKNKTSHEVALLFGGEPVDFDTFGETPTSDPLLLFYRDVFRAFKAGKQEEFLAGHSAKSQMKFRQWWATMSKDASDGYYARTVSGRFVKFVLNADPVFILFYGQNKGRDWVPGSLGYQYVVRNPANQQYLIANVLSQGFFDDVVGNQDLFDQRVLKGPAAPTAPAKSPAVPKKAVTGK
jgi:hypothetical protein